MPVVTMEQLDVLRNMLPATADDIADAIQVAPSRVPAVVRDAKRAGVPIRLRGGLYEGPDQLDTYDMVIMEHRMLKTSASHAETLAGCFPSQTRSDAASRLGAELAANEASYARSMEIHKLQRRRDDIDARLAELMGEEETVS